jgi:hypothetical protein
MWSTLRSSVGDRVHDVDFDVLITRTEGQAHAVERRRLTAPQPTGAVLRRTPPSLERSRS